MLNPNEQPGLFLIYQVDHGRLLGHGIYPTRSRAEYELAAARRDWPSKLPYQIADLTALGILEPRLRWHL